MNQASSSNNPKTKISIVVFLLDGEEYCANVDDVVEVIKTPEITPLPQSPEHIKGFISIRGKVVSVVDMEKKFNLVRKNKDNELSEVLIIDNESASLGVLVDKVVEVISINEAQIQEPPDSVLGKIGKEYIRGIVILNESNTNMEDSGWDDNGNENITSLAETVKKRPLLILNIKKILEGNSS